MHLEKTEFDGFGIQSETLKTSKSVQTQRCAKKLRSSWKHQKARKNSLYFPDHFSAPSVQEVQHLLLEEVSLLITFLLPLVRGTSHILDFPSLCFSVTLVIDTKSRASFPSGVTDSDWGLTLTHSIYASRDALQLTGVWSLGT